MISLLSLLGNCKQTQFEGEVEEGQKRQGSNQEVNESIRGMAQVRLKNYSNKVCPKQNETQSPKVHKTRSNHRILNTAYNKTRQCSENTNNALQRSRSLYYLG